MFSSWVFGGFLGSYSGFELLGIETTVKVQKNHEFSSFPDIASVGFATNPHNLSLHISSITRDCKSPN